MASLYLLYSVSIPLGVLGMYFIVWHRLVLRGKEGVVFRLTVAHAVFYYTSSMQ